MSKVKLKLRFKNLPILIIFLLASLIMIPDILNGQFQFVFDMGRDMIWTRDIVVLKRPYLIGPWASISGVFFGPFWYYFLSIPFILSGGSPTASVLAVFLIGLATIFLGYHFGKQIKKGSRGKRLGLLIAFFLAFSPALISASTFAFHANLLPFTTLLFIYALYMLKTKPKKAFYLPLASFLASLNFHLEPAAAIFTTLTLIIFLLLNHRLLKNIKNLFSSALAFFIPFVPQIIFEFRHKFLQTKSLILYFKGENQTLEGKLPLFERINDRLFKFFDLFKQSVFISNIFVALLILLVVTIALVILFRTKQKKQKEAVSIILLNLTIPFMGFILLFSPELKSWYVRGLPVAYCLLVAIVFDLILDKFKKLKVAISLILIVIFFTNVNPLSRLKHDFSGYPEGNPGTFRNQIQAIDWVYQDAGGEDFSVYVYTPPIYDYHYQYLFWWYGNKTYHYEPVEYSYLPGKKDYIKYKDHYLPKEHKEKKSPHLFYLILEPESVKTLVLGWLDNFKESKILTKTTLPSQITVEKRIKNEE